MDKKKKINEKKEVEIMVGIKKELEARRVKRWLQKSKSKE